LHFQRKCNQATRSERAHWGTAAGRARWQRARLTFEREKPFHGVDCIEERRACVDVSIVIGITRAAVAVPPLCRYARVTIEPRTCDGAPGWHSHPCDFPPLARVEGCKALSSAVHTRSSARCASLSQTWCSANRAVGSGSVLWRCGHSTRRHSSRGAFRDECEHLCAESCRTG
jgi:hypothetical protein